MNGSPAQQSGDLAGRREWLGLAVLALPTLLLSIDLGVLYLALPKLSLDLAPTTTQTLWIMDIYAFMTASLLITMGALGDKIGRRRLLIIGAATFGLASLLAAYSSSPDMLIAARALLGAGGAAIGPSTLALITRMFGSARQRGLAIGVWMSCFMAGTIIGPIVGGLLLQWFWWGSVFLIDLPVMALLLATAHFLLPESRDRDAGKIDAISVAISLVTVLPIIYGIKHIVYDGVGPVPLLLVAVGLIDGYVFVRRQRTLAQPLVDMRLFSNRSFSGALGIMLLGPAILGGVGLFSNQYLQLVLGLTPLAAGLWSILPTLGTIAGAMLAPAVAQRAGSGRVVCGSGLCLAAGAIILTQVTISQGLPLLLGGLALVAFGFGPIGSLGANLIVSAAPPEKAGSAASMSQTCSDLGVALGMSLLGVVGTSVYRGRIAGSLPSGLPANAAQAARDTLAGAVSASEHLTVGLERALLSAARDAFTSGLNTVGAVSAGIGLVIALIAALVLRTGEPSGSRSAEQELSGEHEIVGHKDLVADD